jgi:NADP-dependent 3-hydroxy acid dehydrogenase YdfG
MTKHGVGAFAESLRQEVSERHVRVALVEPGVVSTELFTHIRPEILNASSGSFGADMQMLQAQDIVGAVTYIVTRPARVVINELLVRGDASLWRRAVLSGHGVPVGSAERGGNTALENRRE